MVKPFKHNSDRFFSSRVPPPPPMRFPPSFVPHPLPLLRGTPPSRAIVKMTSPSRPPSPPLSPPRPPFEEPRSQYAQINGVSVHHIAQPSPPTSTLLLCLHGFGASVFSFRSMCSRLLSPRPWLSFVAFDSVGFGLTSRPHSLRYYTPAFSARITLALSTAYAPSRPFALLAHSLGSLGAARAALDANGRCKALVLIAPAMVPRAPLPGAVRAVARGVMYGLAWVAVGLSVLLSPLLALVLRRVVGSVAFWRRGLALARADMNPPEEMVEGYFTPTSAERWDNGVLNFCRAALMDRARALGEGEDYVSMLQEMGEEGPRVLVIHGEQDRVVPVINSRRLVDSIRGARLVVMEGCGHVPHEEQPEVFAEIIGEFLEKAGLAMPDV